METSAGNALTQLAAAAQRQCVIEEDAVESCNQLIKIEKTDATLRQLIQRVASEAGVTVRWEPGKIVISQSN